MRRQRTGTYAVVGGTVGYLVLHPVVMMVSHLMVASRVDANCILPGFPIGEIFQAFSLEMLPWSLSFAIFGMVTGYLYGKVKQEEVLLREANATKDKFLSIIAHDLLGPLGSFRNMLEMVSKDFDNACSSPFQKIIKTHRTSVDNLCKLIENLLTWSRMQRGMLEYHPQRINLAHVVAWNVKLLRSSARQKQITLRAGVQKETFVYGDLNMVDTVIRNLVSNAIKFTESGGTVEISATSVENGWINISVSDTGIGIPEKKVSKLFRIDAKYKGLGTAGETGTGLGLILCRDFVENHGGQIRVESEVGKGTQFTFTLPQMNAQCPEPI